MFLFSCFWQRRAHALVRLGHEKHMFRVGKNVDEGSQSSSSLSIQALYRHWTCFRFLKMFPFSSKRLLRFSSPVIQNWKSLLDVKWNIFKKLNQVELPTIHVQLFWLKRSELVATKTAGHCTEIWSKKPSGLTLTNAEKQMCCGVVSPVFLMLVVPSVSFGPHVPGVPACYHSASMVGTFTFCFFFFYVFFSLFFVLGFTSACSHHTI